MSDLDKIAKAAARHGLVFDKAPTAKHGLITCTLTIAGSNAFCGLALDRFTLEAAGTAADSLIEYEVSDAHTALLLEWQYQKMRAVTPELAWIARGRACPVHPEAVITSIDWSGRTSGSVAWPARTFGCSTGEAAHPMPASVARARGSMLVIEEESNG